MTKDMSHQSPVSDDAVEQIINGEITMENATVDDTFSSATSMESAADAASRATSKPEKKPRKNPNIERKQGKKVTDRSLANDDAVEQIINGEITMENVTVNDISSSATSVESAADAASRATSKPEKKPRKNPNIEKKQRKEMTDHSASEMKNTNDQKIPATRLSFDPSEGTVPPTIPRLESSQTESTVLPNVPTLERTTGRAHFLFPGAVSVPGFSAGQGVEFSHNGDDNSQYPTSSEEFNSSTSLSDGNNDETILVNAHLVVPSEDRDLEAASTAVEYHQPTPLPPMVQAEVMKTDQVNKSTFQDLLRNRTVQILIFIVLLAIIGMSVVMLFGFGSNSVGGQNIVIIESEELIPSEDGDNTDD